jgi:flagellar protein FliS
MNGFSALNQYRQVGTHSGIAEASPHQLVTMLMEGALERISMAKGHMMRNEAAEKGQRISAAISIIDGLQASLDMERGGEMAVNLASLYDYMLRQLLDANLNNRHEKLDEVQSLLREIKEAWVAIPIELRNGVPSGAAQPSRRAAHA